MIVISVNLDNLSQRRSLHGDRIETIYLNWMFVVDVVILSFVVFVLFSKFSLITDCTVVEEIESLVEFGLWNESDIIDGFE